MTSCSLHEHESATHRCDGCGRALCPDCIEEGHRLLICRTCGEMALPLAGEGARTARELRADRALRTPYSLPEAFAYVFRGRGIYVFGSYLAALMVLSVASRLPLVGCLAAVLLVLFVGAVLFILPSTLAHIVRSTAEGDNELPDWPDFYDSDRWIDLFGFLVTGLVSTLPLGLVLNLAGCVRGDGSETHCLLILCAGWLLAMALWVPAFGALSVSQNLLLALRLDSHFAVLTSFGAEVWTVVFLSTLLVLLGQLLAIFAAGLPVIGLAASAAVGMYGWFTAAHLIGVFFRRNAPALAAVYEGRSA